MENTGYPFLDYINEDKSHYIHAKDFRFSIENPKINDYTVNEEYWKTHEYRTFKDPDDLFLVGHTGGFLMNIKPGYKFINTDLFTKMAQYYNENGEYTSYKQGSIMYNRIADREAYRRHKGFKAPCLLTPEGKIEEVRITGEHYNFLNYTQMEELDEESIKQGGAAVATKKKGFPKFIDAQFWTFHCIEFARNNGFHMLIDKTRRGGFSYMMASNSANAVNLYPNKVVINVAVDSKYLTQRGGLTDFALNDLKFYEDTGLFKRGILKTVDTDFRLGLKLKNNVEWSGSWHSALLSVSAHNNPDCAIGKDAIKVNVEEVSTMDNFDKFMEVTEPAMRTGSYTTGFLCAWGTATTEGTSMQEFELNFYNPKAHNFCPFENVWDKDARDQICGFFKSYAWGLQGEVGGVLALDKWGNSNILVALEVAKREHIKKKNDAKTYAEYINYLGQYALYPAESFSSTTENIFSSEELTAWEEKLKMDSSYKFYIDGRYDMDSNGVTIFKSNARLLKEGKKIYDYIQSVPRRENEDPMGCIRRWAEPLKEEITENGVRMRVVPKGLYSITYDPVGIDKDRKTITNKHSHNSIQVWMNPHALNGFKGGMVAHYYGRPDKLEEADRICYELAKDYNCIGTTNVEINRGETVSNFKKWNALKYLSFDPVFVWDNNFKEKVSTSYGYSITPANKLEGLRLLKEFLYEVVGKDENGNDIHMFQLIYDYQSILELKKWSENGNYDRVSSMILRGIEWKAMKLLNEDALKSRIELTEDNIDKHDNDILSRDWY